MTNINLNREYGANFDADNFEFKVEIDVENEIIKKHLLSKSEHEIRMANNRVYKISKGKG